MSHAIWFTWDGESMVPLPRFTADADKRFIIGERYALEPIEDRSAVTHRHYFAAIREAFVNLPEDKAEAFASPDALRKHALIRCGYCDTETFIASSKAEAQRIAGFMRRAQGEDYSIITVQDAVVTRLTAKSQSMKAMPKGEFQASKQATLEFIAGLIGVEPDALSSHARAAA